MITKGIKIDNEETLNTGSKPFDRSMSIGHLERYQFFSQQFCKRWEKEYFLLY